MARRPQIRSLAGEADPQAVLAGFVGVIVEVNARVAPLYGVLVGAAGVDPDAAALLDELTRQRQKGQRMIARAIAGTLRAGVSEREAADVIHALLSPELYRLLAIDRGWKPERYQRWLVQMLTQQLLPPEHVSP